MSLSVYEDVGVVVFGFEESDLNFLCPSLKVGDCLSAGFCRVVYD